MPRLTASEGVELFKLGTPPKEVIEFDPAVHMEEWHDMATGLIGAMLKLGLPSISSIEIGHRIPAIVTHVPDDFLRIFVDPFVQPFGRRMRKGREFVELTALSYQGEPVYMNTEELWHVNYRDLALEIQRHDRLIRKLRGY